MVLKVIAYGSPYYQQMVALRYEVLRKPLGLTFSAEDLERDKQGLLLGYIQHGKVIGCCMLCSHSGDTVKLRQMAVAEQHQKKGIGKKIIAFAEEEAKKAGFSSITLHARKYATGFYKICGYRISGDEFIEVGILHLKMVKLIF